MKTRKLENSNLEVGLRPGSCTRLEALMKKLIMSLALLTSSVSASGADMSKGADNFYKSDKVTAQKVTFKNQYNMTVAGNLFIPNDLNQSAKSPAIVVGHPMGGVNRNGLKHSLTLEQRKKIIKEAVEQRYVEFTGGETKYTSGTCHELNEKTDPIQREFYDFYRTPRGEFTPKGSSPKLTTHPTLSSNVKFMNFYPFTDIETISPRPMLFITGETAHSREFSEEAYRLAGEPKELVIVPNAGHVDLYDRVELIPFDKLTSFFAEHLKGDDK